MDAQNAVVPASTKPPAASLKQPASDHDQHHPKPSTTNNNTIDFENLPSITKDSITVFRASDASQDGDSDTETVVLPGKDGYSPSKVRKIKNEDISESGDVDSSIQRRILNSNHLEHSHDSNRGDRDRERNDDRIDRTDKATVAHPGPPTEPGEGKRKKLLDRPEKPHSKDGSSGLSSAPTSPPPQRRRRPSPMQSDSESERGHARPFKASINDSSRAPDRLVPHKRRALKAESDDDAENRKIRRQRMSGSGLNASRSNSNSNRDPRPNLSKLPHESSNAFSTSRNRSGSPPVRPHRRSTSTHLPSLSTNGLGQKKKRIPAPLQPTDYQSDDSSASASTQARSSKLRQQQQHHLATPATTESAVSPAKMVPPQKKYLDAHGQTFIARACAKGDYELVKQRMQERPYDINYADYAGNSPLQIAAINGHEDIVKLLIDSGCNIDVYNNEKDTPLMDAVENGYLNVVKILLEAGVNPRKANAIGQEPIDNIDEEGEHAAEIRELLKEARQRFGQRRRTSEEHHAQDHTDGASSHGQESPRRSPGPSGHALAASRRAGTSVRATKTSNHLLYMPLDDKTLRQAAARGDEETVMRILQVRDKWDDPESMVNAAKGGHENVMNLLLGIGYANADPKPVAGLDEEMSTPMLACIGQESSLKIIELLLAQDNFDPTRRFKGETYYEIARRRKGPNCELEEDILKQAYDDYKKKHKDSAKSKFDKDLQQRSSSSRTDHKEGPTKTHKRKASSPTRESKKANTGRAITSSPKEKRRSDSFHNSNNNQDEQTSPKRGPGRSKKDERVPTIAVSDREASPAPSKQAGKVKRTESEMAASSEGETVKPRRKLVSRRELNGERDKQQQRRTSLASNASSSLKDPPSPQETRRDELADKQQSSQLQPSQKADKLLDRTKAIKRDDSRDRLTVSTEHTGKRHRTSASPSRLGSSDKEGSEAPSKKKQRLDTDGKEKRRKPSVSPDDRPHKSTAPRPILSSLATAPSASKPAQKDKEDGERKPTSKLKKSETDTAPREGKSVNSDKNALHVNKEDVDVHMRDADLTGDFADLRTHADKENEAVKPSSSTQQTQTLTLQEAMRKAQERKRDLEQEAIRKAEEKARRRKEEKERERRQKEEEEAKQRQEEERRQGEEEERLKRKEEEERRAKEEEERRKLEEEEHKRREEVARKERLEAERLQKEEDERKRQEEEARLIREEEERQKRAEEDKRRKEEDERKKRLEEEQRKRDEEERLRREKLEREAAEEAARLKEEEERKAREEADRKHREEVERRRAAREAERLAENHRIHLEQERLRLSKLPPVLRWLDASPNPKRAEIARKFTPMQGVRYDCIRPATTGTTDGREQWILNTQVALLLGEKDLTLSRYTAWQHIPVSDIAKQVIWRLEADRYALTSPALHDLGRQIPGYYPEDPEHMGYRVIEKLRRDAWARFAALDMFFVKASDLMFIVPTIPHLRSLELAIAYRELPEHESQLRTWAPLQKWKLDADADRFRGFAPRNKYYVNGELVREDLPGLSATSSTPFPEKRVPRKGLQAVSPSDPDYSRLCGEQGLTHLTGEADSPLVANGFHSSPTSSNSNVPPAQDSSGLAAQTTAANGTGEHRPMSPSSDPGAAIPRPLVNGINGNAHHNGE